MKSKTSCNKVPGMIHDNVDAFYVRDPNIYVVLCILGSKLLKIFLLLTFRSASTEQPGHRQKCYGCMRMTKA